MIKRRTCNTKTTSDSEVLWRQRGFVATARSDVKSVAHAKIDVGLWEYHMPKFGRKVPSLAR
jgi:hypothetical protein